MANEFGDAWDRADKMRKAAVGPPKLALATVAPETTDAFLVATSAGIRETTTQGRRIRDALAVSFDRLGMFADAVESGKIPNNQELDSLAQLAADISGTTVAYAMNIANFIACAEMMKGTTCRLVGSRPEPKAE